MYSIFRKTFILVALVCAAASVFAQTEQKDFQVDETSLLTRLTSLINNTGEQDDNYLQANNFKPGWQQGKIVDDAYYILTRYNDGSGKITYTIASVKGKVTSAGYDTKDKDFYYRFIDSIKTIGFKEKIPDKPDSKSASFKKGDLSLLLYIYEVKDRLTSYYIQLTDMRLLKRVIKEAKKEAEKKNKDAGPSEAPVALPRTA